MSLRALAGKLVLVSMFGISIGLTGAVTLFAQADNDQAASEQQEAEPDKRLATIKGSLVLESEIIGEVDWDTMQGSIVQLVQLQQPVDIGGLQLHDFRLALFQARLGRFLCLFGAIFISRHLNFSHACLGGKYRNDS